VNLPWPEMPSSLRQGETVREILDYVHWVASGLLQVGARSGNEQGPWRQRVRQAYVALFLPPVLGHGDPYPPDVPPALGPGIWPDVPAAMLTGMTLRHQLTVITMLTDQLRTGSWASLRPPEIAEWDRRLSRARDALDLGAEHPLPADARTSPSKEVIADAEAREKAIKAHARRRSRRIEKLMQETPKPKKPAGPKKTASRSRAKTPRKAPPPRPAPKGKARRR
jgi:hypothetical protein